MNTDSKSPTALGEGGISPRAKAVVQKRQAASETRAWAGLFKGKSPEDAHARAAQLDAEAAALAAEPPEQSLVVGTGGEIAIHPSEAQGYFDTIQSRPDAIAVDASHHRMLLAREAGVAALALDAAETVQATNSLEKMLAHQCAATHKAGMDLVILGTALTKRFTDQGSQSAILTTEAARLINASARMFDSFQRGALTLHRLRNSGRQTMVVQHVHISDGGQAVVAGQMKGRGRGKRST